MGKKRKYRKPRKVRQHHVIQPRVKPDILTTQKEANMLIDDVLANRLCANCRKPFETAKERDAARVVSFSPFRVIHDRCFEAYAESKRK